MDTRQALPTKLSPPPLPGPTLSPRQQMLVGPHFIDQAIAIVGIVHSTGQLQSFYAAMGIPFLVDTLLRYLLPILIFVRLAVRYKAAFRVLQSDWFLLAFNALVFLSFAWSIVPSITILGLRSEYIQGVMIALFLATRFSMIQQVRLITIALGICAALSFFLGVAIPSTGVHFGGVHDGAWKGFFGHKNYFSAGMTIGAAACLVQILDPRERRIWHLFLLVSFVGLSFLSTSKTGQVLLVAICAIIFIYRNYRWRGMRTLLILYLGVVAVTFGYTVLMAAWDQIFISIGRDPTLSGRTLIWEVLREPFISNRPILGYGRSAFWFSGTSIGAFYSRIGFLPTHAHNGWYDLILDVGYVGLLLYILSAIQAWVRVFRLAYSSNHAAAIWPLAFFAIFYINNYTESLMLYKLNLVWTLYMAACWSLREAIVDEKVFAPESGPPLNGRSPALVAVTQNGASNNGIAGQNGTAAQNGAAAQNGTAAQNGAVPYRDES
ncbi:MAG TPA: O-antigen ligase family protein [Candidatus Obscuribacterales bacterium]